MAGLRRICRAFGGLTVTDGDKTVKYVWDYVADVAVPDTEMPVGSERWKASERALAEEIARTDKVGSRS